AGPARPAVIEAAGLVAAAGGTVRVIETACPPLPFTAALALATEALDVPTDVFLDAAAFPSTDAFADAVQLARDAIGSTGHVALLDAVPASAPTKATAERHARSFVEAVARP